MDVLVLAYAELAEQLDADEHPSQRLRDRIMDIIVLGDDDMVRRRAFDFAKSDPASLCRRVVQSIDNFEFTDAKWGEETLEKCLNITRETRAQWKIKSANALKKQIQQTKKRKGTAK